MKSLSFGRLLVVSLCLSLIGSWGLQALQLLIPTWDALLVMLSVIVFLYVGYLLLRSCYKVGRISSFLTFSSVSIILLVALIPIGIYLFSLLTAIWLTRSFFYHRRFLNSLADAGLLLVGVFLAYWVLIATSSWFLTLWSFFLVQSLFVYIPATFTRMLHLNSNVAAAIDPKLDSTHSQDSRKNFEKAYNSAIAALGRLS